MVVGILSGERKPIGKIPFVGGVIGLEILQRKLCRGNISKAISQVS